MPKLLSAFLLAAHLASATTFTFSDVDVSFSGTELSVASTTATVATCDFEATCPNGNVTIAGLILNGPLTTIGDYYRQDLTNGSVMFAFEGEDPIIATIVDAQLTRWTDETLFIFGEISSPFWGTRFATSFFGITIPLSGSLQVSNESFNAFRTTATLFAYPMYDDPGGGHLPEPGTFALTSVAAVAALFATRRRRRCCFRSLPPLAHRVDAPGSGSNR